VVKERKVERTILRVTSGVGGEATCGRTAGDGGVEGLSMMRNVESGGVVIL
jgi:hypothetical protein